MGERERRPDRLAGLKILPYYKVIDPEALQPTMDLMLKYDLLSSEFSASNLLHDTVLAK